MKLSVKLDNPFQLRRVLGYLLLLRKISILKFTKDHLIIVSSGLNEPHVWCKLSKSNFENYDVESKKDNIIAVEINIEPLYQVLKSYEKGAVTSVLSMKLRRPDDHPEFKNKAYVTLALFYNEQVSVNSEISHNFNIPAKLIKYDSLTRIVEPGTDSFNIVLRMTKNLLPFFKRIERYKTQDLALNLITNKLGELKVELEDGKKRISIQWKGYINVTSDTNLDTILPTSQQVVDDLELIKPIGLRVKAKWLNIGCKLIEMGEFLSFIIHDQGCILHSYIDEDETCDITYYLTGNVLDEL